MSLAAMLMKIARALPDVTEGVACEGTALESRTFKRDTKAFLFVGTKDARLKRASGWTKIALTDALDAKTARAWVSESYALMGAGPVPEKRVKKAAPPKKKRARK
jgi:hypothetical protein